MKLYLHIMMNWVNTICKIKARAHNHEEQKREESARLPLKTV